MQDLIFLVATAQQCETLSEVLTGKLLAAGAILLLMLLLRFLPLKAPKQEAL